ncbi:50S ribosomal protein L22 [Spirochaeta thermophila]|uniref:Large ribosomal subunit protein uL22 n=1 Tax=Winmispira thermophila (strain ATCC 49972 / DSM 6192 / RI 19.B1) TaxID=665571 RepID=E0RQ86_WINT6|nr:50S ribosomal protein L22 [Spirochaeta thermophila]ADN01470.1 50S ribosomal protein L22 [Spirochaeta thermophila DSM 6192]
MKEKSGYRARARYLLVSPKKVRPVADLVRGKRYPEAVAILEHMPQKGARLIKKVIDSAAANALYLNKNLDEDMLYVKELRVDDGPRLKRLWPRSHGRADILLKRMSHITVVVDELPQKG